MLGNWISNQSKLGCIFCNRWCAPFADKERVQLGCGGADNWTVEPISLSFNRTDGSLLVSFDRWCAPYAYKERASLGCGGADKWTVEPADDAFPLTHWDAGSGTIYCDPGYFCPNVTSKV